jgi:type I restriction enzyme S subunit
MSTVGQVGEVSLGRQRAPKYHHGDGMRPYLRVANVFEDRIDTTDVMQMTFADDEFERYRLQPGDVLLNEGQSPHLLGRPAIYRGHPPDVAFTNSLIRFRAGSGVMPEWALAVFRHYMRSRRFMRESRITTNIAHLSATRFSTVEFPVPPVAEQRRIVAAIEEQFSRLDTGVAALERARQNLKRMRRALLQAAVEGRLLDTALATEGVDEESPSKLPSGWSIVSVGDVAEVSGGITKNPKRFPSNNVIPFLRVANVMRDRLDLRVVHNIEIFTGELERFRLRRGDLLVVEGNGSPDQIGRSALWDGSIDPCVHQNHLIRIRPGDQILSRYLNIFWNAPRSMATIQAAASSTSGLYTLSTGKVRGIKVVVPPIRSQHQIVEEVDRQLSTIEALDHNLRIAQVRGQALRSAILATAFSGDLASQDPVDESAAPLLKRIAEERSSLDGNKPMRTRKPRAPREEVRA